MPFQTVVKPNMKLEALEKDAEKSHTTSAYTNPRPQRYLLQWNSISSQTKGFSLSTVRYHSISIWLSTYSDLKTIIGPKTIFGVISAISASSFSIPSHQTCLETLRRAPLVLLWTWINLLPFAIGNQRQPAAIQEDVLNKPWRPMASKRVTSAQARNIMLVFYTLAAFISFDVGGLKQWLLLIVLGHWYNDIGGADTSWVTRNFINACGFVSFSSGAMDVALGGSLKWTTELLQWFIIIGGVVFSTVQMQDMYDQAGDRLRNRKTLPLVVGDGPARWLTVFPIIFWSLTAPCFWGCHFVVTTGFIILGLVVVCRMLKLKNPGEDMKTFKIWNLWMVYLYGLPSIGFLKLI